MSLRSTTTPVPSTSPLGPVLGFTGCTSFAAGTATLSVFFVTAGEPYRFDAVGQYALGLLVGVTYTLGALATGSVQRALAARGVSAKVFLVGITLALAGLCLVPLVFHSAGALYAMLACYAPLTGLLWPSVEGYVSGGRAGAELRSAVGRFNIVWSVTLLPSFLCIPPLLEHSAGAVFLALSVTHALSACLLLRFRPTPAAARHEAHAVPARTRELLRVHRVLHAMSYLVMYALTPYLPTLLSRFDLAEGTASLLAATWLATRLVGFALLERWHGWHGRWSVAIVAGSLVLGGFGVAIFAPQLGSLSVFLAALAAFGFGLAALYNAALYYSFEVGGHEGGGSHEVLIGLGLSIGPACGLLACGLEGRGVIAASQRDGVLLAVITLVCLAGVVFAWRTRRPSSALP